jgi:hypothetical protein
VTLSFADVDGDGREDACVRGHDGLWCAHGRGNGHFDTAQRWADAPFRDIDSADVPALLESIRFGDLDGDGIDDVCARTAAGVACALAHGNGFAAPNEWTKLLADDGHSGIPGPLELVDQDGDGLADLCARVDGAAQCANSDGQRFVAGASLFGLPPNSVVGFGDVNGDRRADVCITDLTGTRCALSVGRSFAPLARWSDLGLRDGAMPGPAPTLVDIDGDGRADLCTRGAAGLSCARSDGSRFVAASAPLSDFADDRLAAQHVDAATMTLGRHPADDGRLVNPTMLENLRPGADDWWVPYPQWSMRHEIEAYPERLSYAPGENVHIMLSTAATQDGVNWTLYRTGWYQGHGARRILDGHVTANPQPLPVPVDHRQPARANWSPTLSFVLPSDAISGVYALRLDSAASHLSFIVTFVVRQDDRHADLIVNRADFTDEAYNDWDGGSNSSSAYVGHTWVTFDRPLRSPAALGSYSYSSGYFLYEYPMVRWLEAQGYDLTYVSDVDLDARANVLARGRALLIVGHDEYWSAAMRDRVERARDEGLHLGLFGSDLVDGLIRFFPHDARTFSRTISDSDGHKNEFADLPLDEKRPPHDNPSDTLTGTHYIDWCAAAHPECGRDMRAKLRIADDMVITARSHPAFRGVDTKHPLLQVLGYEYEVPYHAVSRLPFHVKVLARAKSIKPGGMAPVMVAYQAASGARVFNVGSMHWGHALDGWTGRAALRDQGSERECAPGEVDCFSRAASPAAQITVNVLADFGAVPATLSPSLHQHAAHHW